MLYVLSVKKSVGDKSKASVLRVKGCEGLNEAAKQRNEQIEASAGDSVHKECRKNYTNPKIIKRALREGDSDDLCTTSRGRRSLGSQFSFAKDCLFCGRPANLTVRKKVMTFIQFGHSVSKKRYQKFVRKRR